MIGEFGLTMRSCSGTGTLCRLRTLSNGSIWQTFDLPCWWKHPHELFKRLKRTPFFKPDIKGLNSIKIRGEWGEVIRIKPVPRGRLRAVRYEGVNERKTNPLIIVV